MYNQIEVNSYDQHIWRNERQSLVNRLSSLCKKNNIDFVTDYTKINFCSDKIVQMWLADLLPPVDFWNSLNDRCKIHGTTVFVLTDNFIKFQNLEFVKFFSDPTLHSLFGNYHNVLEVNENPSKLYNCFIQRVDSIRQSWFYFLHLRGLLDKGYVSFLLKQLKTYSTKTGVELFDFIHDNFQLGSVPNFQTAYLELRDKVPYRNFIETEDIPSYIQNSKYSLILETYTTDPNTDCWLIGEKAIRALCYPSIPLLFMQQGAVDKLKSIGFEIENHDEIDNMSWIEKQQKFLDIIEHDLIELNPLLLYNRSMHNREICLKWQKRYQKNNYFDEFLTQVLSH